jgi:hypothetical protein
VSNIFSATNEGNGWRKQSEEALKIERVNAALMCSFDGGGNVNLTTFLRMKIVLLNFKR